MKDELLMRAVKDISNVLQPVLSASYSLRPMSEQDVIDIAIKVNKTLGYELFDKLDYPSLVQDFSVVTRAVSINAMRGK